MKHKITAMALCLSVVLTLTGCASIPDMSDDDYKMVSEYATALLLKYDSANHSRLVDTTEYKQEYEDAWNAYNEAEQAYYDAKQAEEDKRKAETEAQEQGNAEYSENTGNKSDHSGNDGTGGATVIDRTVTLESVLGLSNFSIVYAGSDTMKVYPEDEEEIILTIEATTGSDLLVVYFNVTNTSGSAQTLDMLDLNPSFKFSVNGGDFSSIFQTFALEDDLSVYNGTFAAGETKRLVLVSQVREGLTVSRLSLRTTSGGNSVTTVLK